METLVELKKEKQNAEANICHRYHVRAVSKKRWVAKVFKIARATTAAGKQHPFEKKKEKK